MLSPLVRPILLICASLLALPVQAQSRVITQAIEVRSLSLAEAETGIPVELRGIVVFIEGPSAVFVQDDTSTTFFRIEKLPPFTVGDEIKVWGKTRMGLYLPGIDASRAEVVGHRALAPGIPAGYDDLVFGRYHYNRVAVEGIVRSIKPADQNRSVIRLAMGSRVIEVRVEQPLESDRSLIDYRVRVTGLAAGFINERRQLVQPYVRALGWNEVEVIAPAPPASDVPMISAADLLAFRVTGYGEQRVGIDGIVTAIFSREHVFLRQGDTGFAVRLGTPTSLDPGDTVAVAGFPEMDRFSASVVDAELIRRDPGTPPTPIEIDSLEKLVGPLDGNLVSVPGIVRDVFKTETGATLLLAGKTRTVQTRLPENVEPPAVGARVKITGICQVESAAASSGFATRAASVSLRARTAADLIILQQPPWWTARRLAIVLGVVVSLTTMAALWIAILRRQVDRQTEALRRRIESEAALEERQRIAREFHDTLEQELAGVSLRLDALATREMDEKARQLIGASRNLVSRIQSETRDLIRDLRDSTEIAGDLKTALSGVAARLTEETSTRVTVETPATLPRLPAAVVHDLRMIAREAATNAIKHGSARHVTIVAEATDTRLHLKVTDDGKGFAPSAFTDDRRGHFGCAGIRERARKFRGEVTWKSVPGEGTAVDVSLSLVFQGSSNLTSAESAPSKYEPKPAII